jgi:hypothetical protein
MTETDPLRARLTALVATWRNQAGVHDNAARWNVYLECADALAALLRESPEPKPPRCAEGFHVAENLSTTHHRCLRCGYDWEFPARATAPAPPLCPACDHGVAGGQPCTTCGGTGYAPVEVP